MSKKNTNVLIVDDELGVRESIRMILKDEYNLLFADDANSCMELFNKEKIDLILLDINLPDISGIEVLRYIKITLPYIPVIMITGQGTHQLTIDALKLGASDFIAKPVNVRHIREIVSSTLAKTEVLMQKIKNGTFTNIENTLRNQYLDTLMTLSRIIEAKDLYTKRHSERVTVYAINIANKMGFSEEEIEVMKHSCLLHDIGKVGISDFILCKSEELTTEERKIVEKHPEIGEEILKPIKLLHIEETIVRHHHEKYDGSGYPDGLKGKEIPIYARILAVADSYDAMTSDRPYRRALTHHEVLQELIRLSNIFYDPEIVPIFIKLFDA